MQIKPFSLKKLFIAIVIVLLLIILHYLKISKPVENTIQKILKPVQETVFNASSSINSYYNTHKDLDALAKENDALYGELSAIIIDNSKLHELEEENKQLRELLNYHDKNEKNLLLGQIIGKSTEIFKNNIIINKGSSDNVKQGYPVIIDNGVIIGKISNVSLNTSTCTLLTDNLSKLATTIQNKDNTIGIIEGEHNLSLKMNLIPQNEVINENDTVITSGLEENVPKGLIVGTIESVINKSGDIFQSAIIKPIIPYDKLHIVSIVIP